MTWWSLFIQTLYSCYTTSWDSTQFPALEPIEGRSCRLELLDPDRHAANLYAANALDVEDRKWTYLPYGPFETLDSYRAWVEQRSGGGDPLFYAIIDRVNDHAAGVASYLNIDTGNGTIEVGHINYSPLLQRKYAGTEAMYLMMKQAFGLGYRRY